MHLYIAFDAFFNCNFRTYMFMWGWRTREENKESQRICAWRLKRLDCWASTGGNNGCQMWAVSAAPTTKERKRWLLLLPRLCPLHALCNVTVTGADVTLWRGSVRDVEPCERVNVCISGLFTTQRPCMETGDRTQFRCAVKQTLGLPLITIWPTPCERGGSWMGWAWITLILRLSFTPVSNRI